VQAVATYIKSFSRRFAADAPQAISLADPPAASPDSIARGKGVYERLKCASCHGDAGTGRGAVNTDLKDDWDRPIAATRLTEPWTFRGGATPRDILLRFRTGMSGSPMPSFKDAATDVEMGHLANYVVSLARPGKHITGVTTWVLATLIVWLAALLAGLLLPVILVRRAVDDRRSR